VCYVDPADPEYAVLNRGFSIGMWLGLIPLGLVILFGVGLMKIVRRRVGAATTSTRAAEVPYRDGWDLARQARDAVKTADDAEADGVEARAGDRQHCHCGVLGWNGLRSAGSRGDFELEARASGLFSHGVRDPLWC